MRERARVRVRATAGRPYSTIRPERARRLWIASAILEVDIESLETLPAFYFYLFNFYFVFRSRHAIKVARRLSLAERGVLSAVRHQRSRALGKIRLRQRDGLRPRRETGAGSCLRPARYLNDFIRRLSASLRGRRRLDSSRQLHRQPNHEADGQPEHRQTTGSQRQNPRGHRLRFADRLVATAGAEKLGLGAAKRRED